MIATNVALLCHIYLYGLPIGGTPLVSIDMDMVWAETNHFHGKSRRSSVNIFLFIV